MDDPEFAGRFTREIRSLVKLSHPHIVKVTDVGTLEGMPFAVMQYLPGGSLEDQRPTGPGGQPLPSDPKKISRWLSAIAAALDYIHTQGYVHRDVKPGNILFDGLGHAFLSDFGVAKVLASSTNTAPSQTAMTGAGMVLGTPEYMAPELIMGEPFDGRVDQYALAITVYELLCGRRPFEDETKTRVLVLHTSKPPAPLTAWCQTLPDRLSQVVLKGLAKDPADRYATCAELAKAVAAAAEGAVARDDRVRIKCTACGKTGSLSAADFAKLKAGGGRANCPACKSPIDISNLDNAAPGAVSGGTMKFAIMGEPNEYPVANAPQTAGGGTTAFTALGSSNTGGQRHTPPAPQPARGGATVAMSASGGHVAQPTPAEKRSTPRQVSGTLIERALPRSDEAAASAVFRTLAASESERSDSLNEKKAAENAKAAADKTKIWIAAGASAATLLLALAGFVVFSSASRKEPDPAPSPRATASQGQAPAAGATNPQTPSGSLTPAVAATASAEIAALSGTPKQTASTTTSPNAGQPNGAIPVAPTDEPLTAKANHTTPHKNSPNSKAHPSHAPEPAGVFASSTFDAARLPKKARHLDYPVAKILAKARSYRDEVVVPGGMYCLTRSSADHGSGPRKYTVTECTLKEQGPKRALHMVSQGSTDMEFEPRLAAQLDRNWESLEGRVAILTLWINGSGESGIVRAQILQKFTPKLKPGYGPGQADIDYEVLFVSPDGSQPAKADDGDWQQVGRLNQLYQHHKHLVAGYRKKLQTADMMGLSATMNNMYAGMMKGMAADAAAERGRQRSISGQ
jgi:hypothetical protein